MAEDAETERGSCTNCAQPLWSCRREGLCGERHSVSYEELFAPALEQVARPPAPRAAALRCRRADLCPRVLMFCLRVQLPVLQRMQAEGRVIAKRLTANGPPARGRTARHSARLRRQVPWAPTTAAAPPPSPGTLAGTRQQLLATCACSNPGTFGACPLNHVGACAARPYLCGDGSRALCRMTLHCEPRGEPHPERPHRIAAIYHHLVRQGLAARCVQLSGTECNGGGRAGGALAAALGARCSSRGRVP